MSIVTTNSKHPYGDDDDDSYRFSVDGRDYTELTFQSFELLPDDTCPNIQLITSRYTLGGDDPGLIEDLRQGLFPYALRVFNDNSRATRPYGNKRGGYYTK